MFYKKLTVVTIVLVFLFAYFVYPTPWEYRHNNFTFFKTNRLTGDTYMIYPKSKGWEKFSE